MTDECKNINRFDKNEIQTSLEKEAKLNEVYAKCYKVSAILEKEKETLKMTEEKICDLITKNKSLEDELSQKN